MTATIELEGVGKRYRKLHDPDGGLRALGPLGRRRSETLWALRGINLTVEPGELVGILGRNGAGKTTLLRLLAGVTRPTEGRVHVRGRIAPLISLGVGFHDEMSGRENVIVNGMLLGLSEASVHERFEAIVAFAELEDSIDTPVKFYSSGMTMRLAFSVVAHIDPTVLLVDEVLAVGDPAFQLKCLDRLRAFQRAGAAILMASHSMYQVRQLCPRAVLVRHGRIVFDGDIEHAISQYYAAIASGADGDGSAIEVIEQRLVSAGGTDGHHANYDEPLELVLRLHVLRDVPHISYVFDLETDGGNPITSHAGALDVGAAGLRTGEEIELRVAMRMRLGGGNYRLSVTLHGEDGEVLGVSPKSVVFVASRPASLGVVDPRARIVVDGIDRTDRRASLFA